MTLPGFDDRPILVEVAGHSDTGRTRTQNQDSFLVANLADPADGVPPLRLGQGTSAQAGPSQGNVTLGPRGLLLLVADGMGGAAAGAVASALGARTIHGTLSERWSADRDLTPARFASRLAEAVQAANAVLHERAQDQPELEGMGTTATVVGVLEEYLYVAQVGDSRAYLFRDGQLTQITRDQSMVQNLVDAGQLTPEEAEASDSRNVILQAVGVAPTVDVDLTYQPLRKNDLLLLCSDGLSGVVHRDTLESVLQTTPDLAEACRVLVELANEGGGPDNITTVLARFGGPRLDPPADGDIVGRRPFEAPGT
jgi:protein phosphatase